MKARVPGRRLLSFLAAMLVLSPALAGTNSWTDLGPDGGSIGKVIFHPTAPDTLWAASISGVYRSQDAGASWQLLSETYAADLEIDRAHPNRVYRGAEHLFVSDDGGASFAPLAGYPFNAGAEQVEVSADGMRIYAFVVPAVQPAPTRSVVAPGTRALPLPMRYR